MNVYLTFPGFTQAAEAFFFYSFEEFGLNASTWCLCPIGEEKHRLVSETVRRLLAKG